jgi:hypothetical protein
MAWTMPIEQFVLCEDMPDRAHIEDKTCVINFTTLTLCGRVWRTPSINMSMRICLRCLLAAHRTEADQIEVKISHGEY